MDEQEIIRRLVEIADEEDVHGIEIVVAPPGEPCAARRYEVVRSTAACAEAPDEGEAEEPESAGDGSAEAPLAAGPKAVVVKSPMVGAFHRSQERGGTPAVEVGQEVRAGQTLGFVESLKVLREVVAESAGKVLAVLATDDEPVDFGRPLFELEIAG